MSKRDEAISFCEAALEYQRDQCRDLNIFPRWPTIYDRMMARRHELSAAYIDIHASLLRESQYAEVFFDAVCCAVCVWTPERIDRSRNEKKTLLEINNQIAERAVKLADLMRERSRLEEKNGFHTDTHYHIVDVIKGASQTKFLFESRVKTKLSGPAYQFDLKYWPSLGDIMNEIAHDARTAEFQVPNAVTVAATRSSRSSKADFCRALFESVDLCSSEPNAQLPKNFRLKDESWASLVNVLLDLNADDLTDGMYNKRLRQRSRERAKPKKRDRAQ